MPSTKVTPPTPPRLPRGPRLSRWRDHVAWWAVGVGRTAGNASGRAAAESAAGQGQPGGRACPGAVAGVAGLGAVAQAGVFWRGTVRGGDGRGDGPRRRGAMGRAPGVRPARGRWAGLRPGASLAGAAGLASAEGWRASGSGPAGGVAWASSGLRRGAKRQVVGGVQPGGRRMPRSWRTSSSTTSSRVAFTQPALQSCSSPLTLPMKAVAAMR